MSKAPQTKPDAMSLADNSNEEAKPVCGVIMPISASDIYSDEHWRRVQRIIIKAITAAEMKYQLVWENPEVDVIHSRILHNIYECDVIVCDVSGLNPNVMLELGLRLSTKRPTVVITDATSKPPFDISSYQYHSYPRDLEYNSIDNFIIELSKKIKQVHSAYSENKYKSFVENFTFEVVEPTQVTIPAEEAMRERLDIISKQVAKLDAKIDNAPIPLKRQTGNPSPQNIRFNSVAINENQLDSLRSEIMGRKYVLGADFVKNDAYSYTLNVAVSSSLSDSIVESLMKWILQTISRFEDISF